MLVKTGVSQKYLSQELKKDEATIYYHLKKLIKKEIIEESPIKDGIVKTTYKREVYMKCAPQGRKKIYQLKDPALIYNLVIVYRKKLFNDDETNYFFEIFNLIFFGEKRKILNDSSKIEKDLTNLFYEVFPHPYHV